MTDEYIKLAKEPVIKYLTKKILHDWSLLDTIIIFKKGDRLKIKNYMPVSLGITEAKIFSKVLESRLKPIIKVQQPIKQAGIRRQSSILDHLRTRNQIIEKDKEYQIGIHTALIDYKKAFNTVDHKYV